MENGQRATRKWRKFVIALAAGGAVGFFGAMGMTTLFDSGALGALDTSREIAMLIAFLYCVTALSVAIGVLNPRFGAQFLNVEDAEELREQRRALSLSAQAMIALGLALALLALAAPIGPVPQLAALVGSPLLVALAWWLGARQRRHIDEFMKAISVETGASAFYFSLLIGGGWALLAHLGRLAAPQPLDWLTLLAANLLLAAFWVCGKRGLLMPR